MARESDIAVIGTGLRGYMTALKIVEFGLKVAVIEAKKIGGTCVDRGYIPTRVLLRASGIFYVMQSCDEFGVSIDLISFDFGEIQKYKEKAAVKYRDGVQCGFEKLSVKVVYGTTVPCRGRAVGVGLKEGGREFFRRNAVVITTGAMFYTSRIPGADLVSTWSSGKLLAAEDWNLDRLTIMGGGVIAVELATMFNNLRSHMIIAGKQKHLMAPMGDVMPVELGKKLRQRGIDVYCDAMTIKILEEEGGLSCIITPNGREGPVKTRAGQIFMTIRRRPNVKKLLGRGTPLEMRGEKVAVSNDFETGVRGIYVVGDVSARTQLVHVAATQGIYVMEGIAGRPHGIKLEVMPNGMYVSLPIVSNCVYTDPETATVNITEEIAREKGLKMRCGHFSMRENGKSITANGGNGLIYLVFEAYPDTIVGTQIMCSRATDMIGGTTTAIADGPNTEEMSFAMRA